MSDTLPDVDNSPICWRGGGTLCEFLLCQFRCRHKTTSERPILAAARTLMPPAYHGNHVALPSPCGSAFPGGRVHVDRGPFRRWHPPAERLHHQSRRRLARREAQGWIAGRIPALGKVERGLRRRRRRQDEAGLRLPLAVPAERGEAVRPERRFREQVLRQAFRALIGSSVHSNGRKAKLESFMSRVPHAFLLCVVGSIGMYAGDGFSFRACTALLL